MKQNYITRKRQLKQQINFSYTKSNCNGRICALQLARKQSEEADGLLVIP